MPPKLSEEERKERKRLRNIQYRQRHKADKSQIKLENDDTDEELSTYTCKEEDYKPAPKKTPKEPIRPPTPEPIKEEEDVDEMTQEEFEKMIDLEVKKRLRKIERAKQIADADSDEDSEYKYISKSKKQSTGILSKITQNPQYVAMLMPFVLQIGSRLLASYAKPQAQGLPMQLPISVPIQQNMQSQQRPIGSLPPDHFLRANISGGAS